GHTRIALLVGIQRYPAASGLAQLTAPDNDLRLVHYALTQHLGFASEDIKTLRDGEATLEGIVTWFDRWLIQGARPDTQVLFWFSGHGSEVPDRAVAGRGEPDGRDSTLVAFDSRDAGRAGECDLIDDALRALVRACPSRFVTVVTDACHSGTVLRGGDGVGVRLARQGDKAPVGTFAFWPKAVKVLDDDAPDAALPSTVVHVGAALDHEPAAELSVTEGFAALPGARRFGALTFALVRAMLRAAPGASYAQVLDEARLLVSTETTQSITAEGDLDRALLGIARAPRRVGITVDVLPNGKLRVDAGHLLGVGEGTVLAVEVPGGGAGATGLSDARVFRSDATRAFAEWVRKPERGPTGTMRCSVRSRAFHRPMLDTLVRGASALTALVRTTPGFRVRSSGEAHDYVVELQPEAGGSAGSSPAGTRPRQCLVLRTAGGHAIYRSPPGRSPENEAAVRAELARAARFESRFRSLWRLATPWENGTLHAGVRFVSPTAEECDVVAQDLVWKRFVAAGVRARKGAPGGEYHAAVGRTYDEQSKANEGVLTLLEVNCPQRWAVAVLSLSEARRLDDPQVNILWPNNNAPRDMFVHGRHRIRVQLGKSDRWELPCPVRERYLVIALPQLADFYAYVKGELLRDGPPEKIDKPLPPVLAAALAVPSGERLRAPTEDVGQGGAWGVVAVDLLLRSSPPGKGR
ncbi:MAG: caspase family protein, partial [Planctomycetes bacterium]|nr:caspase family protein [Planctomycetota bacterium]